MLLISALSSDINSYYEENKDIGIEKGEIERGREIGDTYERPTKRSINYDKSQVTDAKNSS